MRLALIAHDNEKVDLVAWASFNRDLLARVQLVGTGHSATLVREKVGLEVETPRAVTSSNAASALADTRGG